MTGGRTARIPNLGPLHATERKETKLTFVHKIKCMTCSLHFAVYSFKKEWEPNTCPECDEDLKSGKYLHWMEPSNQFIFQHVPGSTPLLLESLAES